MVGRRSVSEAGLGYGTRRGQLPRNRFQQVLAVHQEDKAIRRLLAMGHREKPWIFRANDVLPRQNITVSYCESCLRVLSSIAAQNRIT